MSERRWQATALAVIGVMVVVSLVISPDLARSLGAVLPLVVGLGLYAAASFWPAIWSRPLWLAVAWLCLLCLLAAVAPLGMLVPEHTLFRVIPLLGELQRRFPIALNGNVVAGALVMLLPLGPATLLFGGRAAQRPFRALAVVASLIGVSALVLTYSQAGMMAVVVELAVLLALRWPRAARWFAPMLAAAALVAGTLLGWEVVLNGLVGSGTLDKFDGRIEIWSRALLLIGDHPFTGVGYDCFEPVVRAVYPLFLLPHATVTHAHNLFLQVAADLGVPGLLAYAGLLGHAWWAAISSWQAWRRQRLWEQAWAAACPAALAAMLVHGLLDGAQWANKLMFLPWLVMGLAVGLRRRAEGLAQGDR